MRIALNLSFLAVLAVGAMVHPRNLEGQRPKIGAVARFGWGPTADADPAYGAGAEVQAYPTQTLLVSLRLDNWMFGIACVGFAPCPSGVTTFAGGVGYRVATPSPVMPYIGGDVGYMHWTSGAQGMSLRVRAGADVRLIQHVALNFDGSVTRFVRSSAPDRRMLQNGLTGFSAGLKLWM